MNEALLQVSALTKHFPITAGFFPRPIAWVKAVEHVDFEVRREKLWELSGSPVVEKPPWSMFFST